MKKGKAIVAHIRDTPPETEESELSDKNVGNKLW
jgi:hypothetical protein